MIKWCLLETLTRQFSSISITVSDIPGYGRKAELGDRAIGTALEKWTPGSIDTEDNKILTLVAPTYTVGTQETAEKVLSLEDKVNRISSLLGLETGSEAPGIAAMAEKISNAYDDFVRFTESLGLSATTNENGESVLAVNSDMTVTGKTSLSSANVLDTLTVGMLEIDAATNSVNVLGASCYNEDTNSHNKELCEAQSMKLQANRTGNIDLFNGQIVIEPNGDVIIHGVLQAEEIISNEYNVASDAEITGTASLNQGISEVEVKTPMVNEKSRIFITPTTKTNGQQLFVKTKITGNSFIVASENPAIENIEFDWWILNVK